MAGVELIVGAGRLDRTLSNADELLVGYRTDDGLRYLNWQTEHGPGSLDAQGPRSHHPHQLGGRAGGVQERLGPTGQARPGRAIARVAEATSAEERDGVAALIAEAR